MYETMEQCCGDQGKPFRGENSGPGRTTVESLTPIPELENSIVHNRTSDPSTDDAHFRDIADIATGDERTKFNRFVLHFY